MRKRYREYPDQLLLMPPPVRDWLAEDHLAYFVSDVVDQLDVDEITAECERESRGQLPYHPARERVILRQTPSLRRVCLLVAPSQLPDHGDGFKLQLRIGLTLQVSVGA